MLATRAPAIIDIDEAVGRLLEGLAARERSVLEARYGLLGQRPESLRKAGARFRVSREWVRVLQARGLRALVNTPAGERVSGLMGQTLRRMGGIARLDRLVEEARRQRVSIANAGCARLLLAMEGGRCVVRDRDMEVWGLADAPLRLSRPLRAAARSTLRVSEDGMSMDRLIVVLKTKLSAPVLRADFVEAVIRTTSGVLVQNDGRCRYQKPRTRAVQIMDVLREQGRPLHLKEILRQLRRDSPVPPSSHALYECLRRQRAMFVRVAPATFALRRSTPRAMSPGQ